MNSIWSNASLYTFYKPLTLILSTSFLLWLIDLYNSYWSLPFTLSHMYKFCHVRNWSFTTISVNWHLLHVDRRLNNTFNWQDQQTNNWKILLNKLWTFFISCIFAIFSFNAGIMYIVDDLWVVAFSFAIKFPHENYFLWKPSRL